MKSARRHLGDASFHLLNAERSLKAMHTATLRDEVVIDHARQVRDRVEKLRRHTDRLRARLSHRDVEATGD